jgi:hypothetical protein
MQVLKQREIKEDTQWGKAIELSKAEKGIKS